MAYARKYVTDELLPELNLQYSHIDAKDGVVAGLVRDTLNFYMEKNYPDVFCHVEEVNVTMPWVRMFEAGIKIKTKN